MSLRLRTGDVPGPPAAGAADRAAAIEAVHEALLLVEPATGGAQRTSLLRRLARDRVALAGGALLALLVAAVIAGPWLWTVDPTLVDTPNRLASPSRAHPLGTDMLGRDMLARILSGGRTSVAMAAAASVGISLLGLVVGVVTGMLGGWVDNLVMRAVEVVQSVPMLIVAMVAAGLLDRGPVALVLVFVAVGWPGYARVIRGVTLALRERRYVEASTALGASRLRVMVRHLVPNVAAPATVLSTLDMGRMLLGLTALSFLGFGVQPPHPEWGRMMADARPYFYPAPRMLVIPGMAISLLVLAVNLVGDGLRDALDTKVGIR